MVEDRSEFRPNLSIFGIVTEDPGWIYVIRNGDLIKVGKTTDPKRRIFCQARTWLPDLEIIGIKPFWQISRVERHIHEGLSLFWYDREWFKFGDDEYGPEFIEAFKRFYEYDRDMNSVDFIYWYNGDGMVEFAIERGRQGLTLPKWLRKESFSKKRRAE